MSIAERRRIAVYGGSFDPITNAHLLVSAEVIHFGLADEVWFVPCGNRVDKTTLIDAEKRLELVRLAVKSTFPIDFPVVVKSTEIDNGAFIPSIHLLKRFREDFPDCTFSMVVGSDLVSNLKSWDMGEELVSSTEFIIIPRCNEAGAIIDDGPHSWLRATQLHQSNEGFFAAISNLSSTELRKRIRKHGAIGAAGLVPLAVLLAIKDENLYQ